MGSCLLLPGDDSRKKLGEFLTQAQFQASAHSSNFVPTAAAQNLLCLQLAASIGAPVPDPFMTWVQGAVVPVLIGEQMKVDICHLSLWAMA
jgi:DASS family divalent anion:Na+ symporter